MKFGTYMIYVDKLEGEYKEAFQFVEHYADIHLIGGHYKNEKLMDLIDMMMQAQKQETPVENVVGKSQEQFAKDFYSDVTLASLSEDFFSKLKNWAWLIVLFEGLMIVSSMGDEGFNLFTFKADMSGYLQGVLIAYMGILLADVISIILAKFNYYNEKLTIGMMIGFTLVIIAACIYMGVKDITISARSFPVMICAAIYLLIYYVAVLLYRVKKTGSIKKVKDEYDTSFGGLVKAELESNNFEKKEDLEFLKSISKRYANKNKKRVSKGLTPLTTADYIHKQNKLGKYSLVSGYLFGVIAFIIITFINKGFETSFDAVIFIGFMAVIGLLVFKFQRFMNSVSDRETSRILSFCEERGVEMDELYEQLQACIQSSSN